MRKGPVILGFDGTPASVAAVREAATLLAPRPALAVVVWEAGRSFEAATLPEQALEEPPGPLDTGTAFAAERAASDAAERLAENGAALAREAGWEAEGMVVADETTVPDTLVRLARELDAQAVVVGASEHRRLTGRAPGRTLAGLLHAAPCPVLVCGAEQAGTG